MEGIITLMTQLSGGVSIGRMLLSTLLSGIALVACSGVGAPLRAVPEHTPSGSDGPATSQGVFRRVVDPPVTVPSVSWNGVAGTTVHMLWLRHGRTEQRYPTSTLAWPRQTSFVFDVRISTDVPIDHALIRLFSRLDSSGTPMDDGTPVPCGNAQALPSAGNFCSMVSRADGEQHYEVRVSPFAKLVTIEADWYIPAALRRKAATPVPLFDSITNGIAVGRSVSRP